MRGQADERRRGRDLWVVGRAIVLQLLRDDHEERWARAELAREISDFEPALLDEALARLERDGVLHREESWVWASRAARRLDELELISI
jgi:DNA-binding HxlR family transcriptional regulator